MRKWFTRIAVLLAFFTTAYLCVALRPAWQADSVQFPSVQMIYLEKKPAHPLRINYTWNLANSPARTVFVGDEDIFRRLKGKAAWTLNFSTEGEKLIIGSAAPILHAESSLRHTHTQYGIYDMGHSHLRMPNGKIHRQQHIMLVWKISMQQSFQNKESTCLAVQEIVLDAEDGAADLVTPVLPKSVTLDNPVRHLVAGAPSGLPERFCGSRVEQELLRFLFRMASVCDEQTARTLAPKLRHLGHELLENFANPAQPWPDCWGTAAPTARLVAHRVIPLLQEWQANGCYGVAELADFVNGPVFGRIFGESFTHSSK